MVVTADQPAILNSGERNLQLWGSILLLVITCVVVWKDVERYVDPVGEKTVIVISPGSADFTVPFMGARALVTGADPYLHEVPELDDPYLGYRGIKILTKDGRVIKNLYPPSLLLLHVPLALYTPDWREAGRIFFRLNVALLFVLAVLTWWFLVRITGLTGEGRRWSLIFVPLAFFILACNVGTAFGLERGQSDIFGSVLCWGAVAAMLTRRTAIASFLATVALLTKGYAVLFTLGLLLLPIPLGAWRRALIGAGAAVVLLLLPVWGYLPVAIGAMKVRAQIFVPSWYNHGFANVFWNLSPKLAGPGSWVMLGISCLAALACWWRCRQAIGAGDGPLSTLWCLLFTTCSLLALIGWAESSMPYNLIYLLPGVLVSFALVKTVTAACKLPAGSVHIVGGGALVSGFLLFDLEHWNQTLTLPGIGLVLFILTIAGSLLAGMGYDAAMKKRVNGKAPDTMAVQP